MQKPGCPFNHFGPCLTDKCRFYLPVLNDMDNCAILANYTEALCTGVDINIMSTALDHIRVTLGLTPGPLEEHERILQLQRHAAPLKRIAGAFFVAPAVAKQAQACLAKLNRMLDILCEEDENNTLEDP